MRQGSSLGQRVCWVPAVGRPARDQSRPEGSCRLEGRSGGGAGSGLLGLTGRGTGFNQEGRSLQDQHGSRDVRAPPCRR